MRAAALAKGAATAEAANAAIAKMFVEFDLGFMVSVLLDPDECLDSVFF